MGSSLRKQNVCLRFRIDKLPNPEFPSVFCFQFPIHRPPLAAPKIAPFRIREKCGTRCAGHSILHFVRAPTVESTNVIGTKVLKHSIEETHSSNLTAVFLSILIFVITVCDGVCGWNRAFLGCGKNSYNEFAINLLPVF